MPSIEIKSSGAGSPFTRLKKQVLKIIHTAEKSKNDWWEELKPFIFGRQRTEKFGFFFFLKRNLNTN